MTDESNTTDLDAAEARRVARLTDAQVLDATNRGQYGPAIVGRHLHERSQRIMKDTGGGIFGPAITDPDYDKKQRAARAAAATDPAVDDDASDDVGDAPRQPAGTRPAAPAQAPVTTDGPIDPSNLTDPRNPWTYVTLSGAKILAQEKQVSHPPRVKRAELIAALQAANVVPPAIPTDTDDDDEPGPGA